MRSKRKLHYMFIELRNRRVEQTFKFTNISVRAAQIMYVCVRSSTEFDITGNIRANETM